MSEPLATIDRLVKATNEHDLDRLVACFADDYENQTPAHPKRGFRGPAQVRRNWEQIFAFVPDIKVEVIRSTADRDTVWTEWEMHGTRRDGTRHHMAGVIVFGVENDVISWARFYLEPVDDGDATVDDAVRAQVARK